MVPVLIESARHLLSDRPHGHEIKVLEIDVLMGLEVLVPNIPAAHDRNGVVNDEGLVVHPLLDSLCSEQVLKRPCE